MNKYIRKIIALGIILGPVVAYAQGLDIENKDFKGLVQAIIENIARPAIVLILGAAVVFFLWNILQYIRKADQPEELEKFKSGATWGIVAIFVMVSVWGLVAILVNTFNPGASYRPDQSASSGVGNSVFQPAQSGTPGSSSFVGAPAPTNTYVSPRQACENSGRSYVLVTGSTNMYTCS